jgi:MFS family permease
VENYHRWFILGLLFACRTGLGVQFQTLGSVSTSLVSELAFSNTEIGTLIGLFMLPGLLLSIPAGFAGRYFSDRHLVAFGLFCMAAGGAIAAVAQGFGLLALARFAAGIGFVTGTLYMTKMIADWFSGKELATAMGLLVSSWPFGIAMAQIGQSWIAAHHDWRWAFVLAAVYCAAGSLAVFKLYRSPANLTRAPSAKVSLLPRTELVLTLLAASVWGLFNAGYVVYLSFAPRMLTAAGYGTTEASAVISIASWVMIFSIAVFGQIADRTGQRDRLFYFGASVAILVLLMLPNTEYAVLLSLLFGLIGAAPAGVIMALTAEAMSPQRRAFGMGVFFNVFFLFMAFAPPIAGWLFDRGANPYWPILFAAAAMAGAMLSHIAFRRMQRRYSASV